MEEERKKAYSEVIEILKLVDDERLEKIPFEFVQLIKANSDPQYKPKISKDISLDDQNLRDETYAILAWIANKYWGEEIYSTEDFKEKESIKNEEKEPEEVKKVEEKTESVKEIRNAGVYNDIEPECLGDYGDKLPILTEELSWYKKLKAKIVKLFKILFRIKSEKEGVNE